MSEIIFFEPKGTLFLKDLFDDISKDIYKIKIWMKDIHKYLMILKKIYIVILMMMNYQKLF